MADEETKKQIRELLKKGPMTAVEIGKEIKKDKKTVNSILYKIEDVEFIKTSGAPKWRLKSSSSPTVATDSTTRLSDIPPSPSATSSASSGATPLKDTKKEELKEQIARLLPTDRESACSTIEIVRKLNDPSVVKKDVTNILHNSGIAESIAPAGQKPFWVKKEFGGEVTTPSSKSTGTKLELKGKKLYTLETDDDIISFVPVTDENIGGEGAVKSKPTVSTDSPSDGSSLPSNSSATAPPTEGMSSLSLSETDLREAVLNHLSKNKNKSFRAGDLKDLLNQPTRDKVYQVLQQLVKEGMVGENNDGTFNALD
uniref:Uncharacterized protein n=1 Tax=Amphimedon queenslandica TaxID=400682 RepID=A0A1X7SYZ5_AMPQE